MIKNQIAEKLTPILLEIEGTLLDNDMRIAEGLTGNPGFGDEALRAVVQIFMSVLGDKLYVKDKDKMEEPELYAKATQMGKEFRGFVKFYLGVDTHNLYKED